MHLAMMKKIIANHGVESVIWYMLEILRDRKDMNSYEANLIQDLDSALINYQNRYKDEE